MSSGMLRIGRAGWTQTIAVPVAKLAMAEKSSTPS
jgi:hypothetical protein